MKIPVLLVALGLAGCTMDIVSKAQPTPDFPRTWDASRPAPNAARRPDSAPTVAPRGATSTRVAPDIVAVLPFDLGHSGIDADTRMAFEEAIRSVTGDALSSSGFTVLTGETTLAVLADNGVDASQACESSCALQAARELKAKVFVSGAIARTEGEYVAFVRVFEAQSGRQLGSLQLDGAAVKDLRRAFTEKAPAFYVHALHLE